MERNRTSSRKFDEWSHLPFEKKYKIRKEYKWTIELDLPNVSNRFHLERCRVLLAFVSQHLFHTAYIDCGKSRCHVSFKISIKKKKCTFTRCAKLNITFSVFSRYYYSIQFLYFFYTLIFIASNYTYYYLYNV